MRKFGILSTVTMFLLLMGSAFTFAQDEKPKGDDKPKAEESRPQEAKPAKEDKQAQKEQEKAQKDQDKAQKEQEKNAKRDEKSRDDMNARQDNRNRPMDEQQKHQHQADNRQDMARNGNRGKHIPDDKFRQHFGRQHTFHVQRTQIVNVSQPVVVYGGYNFQLVDAWPVGWGYDDDCYIDYVDDGYYLFDVMHPGVRIAVFVAE